MASTIHSANMDEMRDKEGNMILKPECIAEYNDVQMKWIQQSDI
jgi:hypothetical protein